MPISDWPPSDGGLGGDRHAAVLEAVDEVGILRREGLERAAIGVDAGDLLAGDDDVADLALVDLGQELRIGDVLAGSALPGILEQVEERDQDQPDDHPQRKITEVRVHARPLSARGNGPPPASQVR